MNLSVKFFAAVCNTTAAKERQSPITSLIQPGKTKTSPAAMSSACSSGVVLRQGSQTDDCRRTGPNDISPRSFEQQTNTVRTHSEDERNEECGERVFSSHHRSVVGIAAGYRCGGKGGQRRGWRDFVIVQRIKDKLVCGKIRNAELDHARWF
jgi:hypothetical protein